jgi:hypothetical protein
MHYFPQADCLISEVGELRRAAKDLAEVSSQHTEARAELLTKAALVASMREELDAVKAANNEEAIQHKSLLQKVLNNSVDVA